MEKKNKQNSFCGCQPPKDPSKGQRSSTSCCIQEVVGGSRGGLAWSLEEGEEETKGRPPCGLFRGRFSDLENLEVETTRLS